MGVFVREDGRLRSGWRVTLYLLIYLFGMLVSQGVVLGVYSTTILLSGRETMAELTGRLLALKLPLGLFVALKAVDVAWILLLTWLLSRFVDRRRLLDLGLRRRTGWLEDTALGLVLGAAQMAVIVGVAWIAGWVKIAPLPYTITVATLQYTALGLVLFVLVAVGEELVFRGYVQTTLQEGASSSGTVGDRPKQAAIALAVSSILFGLFHALNPNLTGLAMLNLILAGVALGTGYWATGSLWLPIAYHLSWNFVQGSILGLPVSGMRYGGLVMVADWGRAPLLTGHTFGPEGGLLGTAMLLGTIGVFGWWGWKGGRVEEWKAGRLDTPPHE